jgi:RES domain-containing protein
MKAYPQSATLESGLAQCMARTQPWSGTLFRFATVRYANRADLLHGLGSRLNGGRWNPPGLFNCIYGSLNQQTALDETLASYRAYGIPADKIPPQVLVSVAVKLQAVVDLTAGNCLHLLGANSKQIKRDWQKEQNTGREAVTQAIGRLAWEARLEGIIVPSARSNGTNLVLFPSRRRVGSSWKIQGARQLPKQN